VQKILVPILPDTTAQDGNKALVTLLKCSINSHCFKAKQKTPNTPKTLLPSNYTEETFANMHGK